MKKLILIAAAMLSLSACTTIPPLNFSVPNVGPSRHRIDAEVKSVTVTVARPDEKTGALPPTIQTITPQWKEALQEALDRNAIFKDDASRKVSISVKILEFDIPGAGASMTTTATARYEILDRSTGAILYSENITTDGVVPFNYAFVGVVRSTESVNRAVQNNIAKFLMALETVNVNKPMFNGRKK